MKLITWKELFEIKGDVVYSLVDEFEIVDGIIIQYTGEQTPCQRVVDEPFPITTPDYEGCMGWDSNMEMLFKMKEGVVSDLETSGDVIDCYNSDQCVVIYDKQDIDKWISKLQSLDIRY